MILLIGRVVDLRLLDNIQTVDIDHIDCLSDIEALRKATVVSVEESKNVFMWSLISLVNFYPLINQLKWVDHKSYTVQELTFPCLLQDIGIKFLLIRFRDDIPCFGCASVAVIDGVKPKILDMPAKGGELHAHINPRNGNSTNLLIILLRHTEDGAGRFINIVEIEERSSIVKVLINRFRRLVLREARSILMSRQIGRVLYRYLISLLKPRDLQSSPIYYLPILILHLGFLSGSFFLEPKLIILLEILSVLGKGFYAVGFFLLIEGLGYIKKGDRICNLRWLPVNKVLPCLA